MASLVERSPETLGDVADLLAGALAAAGYSDRAYFSLKKDRDQLLGFALITRMERIDIDGVPYPEGDRFLPIGSRQRFDLVEFIRGLFLAPVGYYRILVFTVASAPLRTDGAPLSSDEAHRLLNAGGLRLDRCMRDLPFNEDMTVAVLIYEFQHAPEAVEEDQVRQLNPSRLSPALHLARARIFGNEALRSD